MKYDAGWGGTIADYISKAIGQSQEHNQPVECEFNGVEFTINGNSDPDSVYLEWDAAMKANAEAYRKSPEGIKAAQDQKEWLRKEEEKKKRVAALELKPMTLKDRVADEYAAYVKMNSDSGYSMAVITFTERWAALMEIGISQLNDRSDAALSRYFVDNAEKMCSEADTEGITGFMYGCAVSALAKFWVHGELLRRWHNIDTQIGNEGEKANETSGTLNPALLNIG